MATALVNHNQTDRRAFEAFMEELYSRPAPEPARDAHNCRPREAP